MIYLVFRTRPELSEEDEIFLLSNSDSPYLVNITCEDYKHHLLGDLSKRSGCNRQSGVFDIECLKKIIILSLKESDFLLFGLTGIGKNNIYSLIEMLNKEHVRDKNITFIYNSDSVKKQGVEKTENINSIEDFNVLFSKYENSEMNWFKFKK